MAMTLFTASFARYTTWPEMLVSTGWPEMLTAWPLMYTILPETLVVTAPATVTVPLTATTAPLMATALPDMDVVTAIDKPLALMPTISPDMLTGWPEKLI